MTDKTIRILIADDHAIVREGLRALLATEPGLELVAEATDGVQAVSKANALKPDVILLDMVMPRMDGQEAIVEIKKNWPEARIIVLTSFSDDERVFSAIRSGALGYLLKDSSPHDLLHAIHTVANGEGFLSPTIASKVIREINQPPKLPPTKDPLTEREMEILKHVAQGMTNDEIAEQLVVSERTVRTHVSNILAKLQLANRTQAALYALKEGIASL
ncbi:MAG TPA: response regulator transcription factor [Anaerolineales bacterium]|nr:response regulator transcription factor [Anaerolineales bacterium]